MSGRSLEQDAIPVYPLASMMHPADRVRELREAMLLRLREGGLTIRVIEAGSNDDPGATGVTILLVLTGGSEAQALKVLAERSGPVLVLAHPRQNSLPAALEILAWVRQQARPGRIEIVREGTALTRNITVMTRLVTTRQFLQTLRLGALGEPSDWLVGSMPDPAVVRRIWGPTVVPVPLAELRETMAGIDPGAVADAAAEILDAAAGCDEPTRDDVGTASRVQLALQALVARRGLGAVAVRCFDLVRDERTTGCLALSRLNDDGIVGGCEGDVPATLTMAWLAALAQKPAFMANPQDLDAVTGDLWLAHCTIARRLTRAFRLRSHFESGLGVGVAGELPVGPVTVARIGGRDLDEVFIAGGEVVANEADPARCRTQVRVRLESGVDRLLSHPLGNHLVLVPGDWAWALEAYREWFSGPVERQ